MLGCRARARSCEHPHEQDKVHCLGRNGSQSTLCHSSGFSNHEGVSWLVLQPNCPALQGSGSWAVKTGTCRDLRGWDLSRPQTNTSQCNPLLHPSRQPPPLIQPVQKITEKGRNQLSKLSHLQHIVVHCRHVFDRRKHKLQLAHHRLAHYLSVYPGPHVHLERKKAHSSME